MIDTLKSRIKELEETVAFYTHGTQIKEIHFDESEWMELKAKVLSLEKEKEECIELAKICLRVLKSPIASKEGTEDIEYQIEKLLREPSERTDKGENQCGEIVEFAKKFHEVYERLASDCGYETRKDTRDFNANSVNGSLMISTVREVMQPYFKQLASERDRNKQLEIACADFSGRNVTLHTENLELKRQIETQQKRIEEGWEREKELRRQLAQERKRREQMEEALKKIKDLEWQEDRSNAGPTDCTPKEKGLLEYVGTVWDISREALAQAGESSTGREDTGEKKV